MSLICNKVCIPTLIVGFYIISVLLFIAHLSNLKTLQISDNINNYNFGSVFHTNNTHIETLTGHYNRNYAKIYTRGFLIDNPDILVNIMLKYPTKRMAASSSNIYDYVEEFKTRESTRVFVDVDKEIIYNDTIYWLGYENNIDLTRIIDWFLGSIIALYLYITLLFIGWGNLRNINYSDGRYEQIV